MFWVDLGREHVQVLKKSTQKSGQGEKETQNLKQTSVHEEKGRNAWRRRQEREVITPASLDNHLAGVHRIFQLHLALESSDTRYRGDV